MHDGGAFADVGAQTHAGGVGDAHAARHHVVGHLRELVHREHFQQLAAQTGTQLALAQFGEVDRALAGPGHVRQQREDAGQGQAMRLDQAMGQQVQLEVGLGSAGQLLVFGDQGDHQRLVALGHAFQNGGLLDEAGSLYGFGQAGDGTDVHADGLVAALIVDLAGDGMDQLGRRVEQRLRVVHLEPLALLVLGADAEGQGEQLL